MEVVQKRIVYAKRQVNNLKSFITRPVGVFETADRVIETFRRANRETLSAILGYGSRAYIGSRTQFLRRRISTRLPIRRF